MRGPRNKVLLTPEQEDYLQKNYATVIHHTLCETLGISKRTLVRIARERGLVKDMKAIEGQRRERLSSALRHSIAMDRRKNTGPENGIGSRFQKGYNAIEFFGEEKFREMHRKAQETRRQHFLEDRARYRWGLPLKYRMRVSCQPREKILTRSYLKKRGYILDEDNCIAYWTPETRRATRLEARPRKFYYFKPYQP